MVITKLGLEYLNRARDAVSILIRAEFFSATTFVINFEGMYILKELGSSLASDSLTSSVQ